MLYSKTIETPIGEMLACASEDGICLLIFTDSPDLNSELEKLQVAFQSPLQEQTQTLGDLKALRAVAGANGANKIPIIIPCHRVVGAKGSLTGYSGGLWRKRFLLDLESSQHKMEFK